MALHLIFFEVIILEWKLSVIDVPGYDLYKTIVSGQMFRFKYCKPEQEFTLQSLGRVAKVRQHFAAIEIAVPESQPDAIDYWINYLALRDTDDNLYRLMSKTEFLREAYAFSKGIRILKQSPWEALVCFIISQRSSIPKIRSCVDKVCRSAGSEIFEDTYAFPTPEQLSSADLIDCSLGYRAPYLFDAADKILSGAINLDSLRYPNSNYETCLTELCRIRGVGVKVASCVALFALGHTSSFPIDVWIERAMTEGQISQSDIASFGEDAGLVQQYIYYYMLHRYGGL